MIEVGKTYAVNHSRKGKFVGTITSLNDDWADVLITDGKARAMLEGNEREQGETVSVRLSLCTFQLLEAA